MEETISLPLYLLMKDIETHMKGWECEFITQRVCALKTREKTHAVVLSLHR